VKIASGIELCNAILLPETGVKNGEKLHPIVAGPNFRESFSLPAIKHVFRNWRKMLSGSDRIYRHTPDGILLEYTASESLVDRQIALTEILRREHIPVPKIYYHNPAKRQMLLEDFGGRVPAVVVQVTFHRGNHSHAEKRYWTGSLIFNGPTWPVPLIRRTNLSIRQHHFGKALIS